MPDPVVLIGHDIPSIRVALEPAHNALNSLLLIDKADHYSGLQEWTGLTRTRLSQQRLHTNKLVLQGLYQATVPDRSWESFPAYVQHLSQQEPAALRDRILDAYLKKPSRPQVDLPASEAKPRSGEPFEVEALLRDEDEFIRFLQLRFHEHKIDEGIERQAHGYLNDPVAMQALIVDHFRDMWDQVLAAEWERTRPQLEAALEGFRQLALGSLSRPEAVRLALGREPNGEEIEHLNAWLDDSSNLVLVPSPHLGPYIGKFKFGRTLWLLFGARIPPGAMVHAPDLSRADILVRISALADDTRLQILRLVSREGELRSQAIMSRLGISQSAASRHLKQLSATGLISERRCEGAKCYSLNTGRIEDTLDAISGYLLNE